MNGHRLRFCSVLAPALLSGVGAAVRSCCAVATALAASFMAPAAVLAETDLLDACYRADQPFPRFYRFWHEPLNLPDDPDAGAGQYADKHVLGGSVHVFVRNTGSRSLAIEDILLEGVSLKRGLAFSDQRIKRKFASIHFADLPEAELNRLVAAGEPVWWKTDPQQIAPGGSGEVMVRLRQRPPVETLRLALKHAGGMKDLAIPIRDAHPRMSGISFAADRGRAYLYSQGPGEAGGVPARIIMDGEDITRAATIAHDPAVGQAVAVVRFAKPLAPGSFHCFQVVYEDRLTASAGVRAWADDFAYGMWGGRPADESQIGLARGYVKDITDHNINVQMPQLGSRGVAAYFKSDAGQRYCKTVGLRKAISDPGKYDTKDAFAYFIHDEPDAGDYLAKGVEEGRKVGCLAQWAVGRTYKLRAADPVTPQFLNVDGTFKPENWYTYGQLPDIFATDPYYQARLRGTYQRHPHRLALYAKATYIYAVARVARSACTPRPLHVILNAVSHVDKANKWKFRFATPQEKRIEVYYALAAGASGISYWWYTPVGRCYGVGAAASDPQAAALWREIGFLGAEVRTAGPLILRSCPTELPAKVSTPTLWTRCLLAGLDAVVMIVVNEQYANDRVGTVYQPIEEATVTLKLPSWLRPKDVFEISHEGTQAVTWKPEGSQITMTLGRVELTRLVVICEDPKLRGQLQDLYETRFAAKVARLVGGQRRR